MQKRFTLILVLAVVIALGGYFLYQQQTKSILTIPVDENANPDSIWANRKTYTNTQAKVSFEYPGDWTVKLDASNNEYKRISAEGKEGKIFLDYGAGFGGACPSGYEDFKVGNAQTQACHTIEADGSEKWSLSTMKKNNVNFNDISYEGLVTATTPYKDNRDVILKILSTFKFTN